jgi:hyperosmotically inducible periplasmic protein
MRLLAQPGFLRLIGGNIRKDVGCATTSGSKRDRRLSGKRLALSTVMWPPPRWHEGDSGMKAVIAGAFALAVVTGVPVSMYAATPQAAAVKQTDQTIDDQVESRIKNDATLKKHTIVVTVDDGVVTLTGTVPTEAESAKAARIAKVAGVTRVNNNLIVTKEVKDEVKGTSGRAVEKTKAGAEKAGEKTKEGAEKVGEKTKEGLSKTGEVITDAWITSRVSSKFVGEDLLKDSDIDVDTKDHVVTLSGTVMSAAAKARAVAEAKEVEGVKSVVDRLTVGPKKP